MTAPPAVAPPLPSATPVPGANTDNAAWHAARARGLGGSDVAAIMGVNPYRTALDVWVEKVGGAPADRASEEMYWGVRLEPVVAEEFARRNLTDGEHLAPCPMVAHVDRPWQLANVDRLVLDFAGVPQAVLECKTTGPFSAKDWHGEELPAGALWQVHHYLSVTGLPVAYLAVLIGGQRFKTQVVHYDPDLDERLVQVERDFWRRVERRDPPALELGQSTRELVKALYPVATDDTAELDGELADMVAEYRTVQATEKDLAARKEYLRSRLTYELGPYAVGTVAGKPVCTYKDHARTALDQQWLREQHPAIYAEATRTQRVRTFRLL